MNKIDELVSSGKSLLENGDFNNALSYFEQALLLDQKNPDSWNYKGAALRSLGLLNLWNVLTILLN